MIQLLQESVLKCELKNVLLPWFQRFPLLKEVEILSNQFISLHIFLSNNLGICMDVIWAHGLGCYMLYEHILRELAENP